MMKKIILSLLLLCLSCYVGFAQQPYYNNHYFINPFLINPSCIAPDGYAELYVNYRKQWIGVSGAPTTSTASLHVPLNAKAAFAVSAFKDEAGLLKTTSGLATFAYHVYLGKSITQLNRLSFGLSAGLTSSRVDPGDENFNDPVVGNNTASMDGQFGLSYQYNRLRVGFTLPKLFQQYSASKNLVNANGIDQINNTIASLSYNVPIGSRFSFEPMITYRTFQGLKSQVEGLVNIKVANVGWIGGSYRQDYGAAGFVGLSVRERVRVGYAYEFATTQHEKIGNGAHEVQLIVRLSNKKYSRDLSKVKTSSSPIATTAATEEVKTPDESIEEQQLVSSETTAKPDVAKQDAVNKPAAPAEDSNEETQVSEQPVTRLNGEHLAPGHYVVVGAFKSVENAKNYAATLKRSGYPASVAYHPEKGYYIVHMMNAPTVSEAAKQRDKYRQMSRYSFRDTWILSIE